MPSSMKNRHHEIFSVIARVRYRPTLISAYTFFHFLAMLMGGSVKSIQTLFEFEPTGLIKN